jgi:hypothetical protein
VGCSLVRPPLSLYQLLEASTDDEMGEHRGTGRVGKESAGRIGKVSAVCVGREYRSVREYGIAVVCGRESRGQQGVIGSAVCVGSPSSVRISLDSVESTLHQTTLNPQTNTCVDRAAPLSPRAPPKIQICSPPLELLVWMGWWR